MSDYFHIGRATVTLSNGATFTGESWISRKSNLRDIVTPEGKVTFHLKDLVSVMFHSSLKADERADEADERLQAIDFITDE